MNEFVLEIDSNNVQSEILNKPRKRKVDVFQQDVQHVNWREDVDMSSVDGEEDGKRMKFKNLISTIGDTSKVIQNYGATQDGRNVGEVVSGRPPIRPSNMEVRILGMKPLVFTVVALGVVIASGIAIAKIGSNASVK